MEKFDGIKEKLKNNKLVEFFGKLSKKVKILIIAGLIAIVAIAIILAVVLNSKEYVVLFSGVTDEEATQIVGKLQEDGVQYQYKGGGTILVDETVADQTRANLAYEGYPKSGFTYDVFTQNAGGMTTDTEKQTYKLYELQNRIGATIGLFDGVKDAKVTIALKEDKKYALEDENENEKSSASVVVTMEDGGSPSEKQAAAIQRLVAKSVPEMQLENVAVFDGNGLDVSVETEDGRSNSGDTAQEIATIIENQITRKVINVLGPFYGADNIRVSAKGQVNMERVLRETTTYETPEKIDEEDKRGIIEKETITNESSTGGGTTGGVAGAETNADVSEYTNTTGQAGSTYRSQSAVRDYLVNQIKEQGELDPGYIEDLTVAVSVNGNTLGNLTETEALSLVANATGIAQADQEEKITIVAAPFYEEGEAPTKEGSVFMRYLPFAGGGLALLLLIGLLVLLLLRRRRRKQEEEEVLVEEEFMPVIEENIESEENLDILNLQGEKSRELREMVRAFASENPELSAQMLKTWLNGGESDGGHEH